MSIIWLRQGKELSERRWKVASWIPNKVQTPSELYWILYIELLEIEDKAEDVLKKPYDLDGSLHFLGDKPLGGLEMPRGSEEVLVEVVVSASVSCPK